MCTRRGRLAARVLLVEDEEAVAFTLREILADEGYQVETAASAAEALAKIEGSLGEKSPRPYDAALLDLRVGGDSGLAILSSLKSASPDTVALILTGYGSLETAIEAMRQGAFDYLLKPCNVHDLKAALIRGLEHRQRAGLLLAHAQAAREELERALRARDDFLNIAGHELKTPLSVMIGWAQYVQRQLARGASEDALEKLETLVGQARRVARLVEEFIDVVRIQHGSLVVAMERQDLRPLVEGALGHARRTYLQHEFCFEFPDYPVLVQVDGAHLSQALAHLVDNAAKFSPQGGEVLLRLTVKGGEACVAIQDQGVGILPDDLPLIFERFYQADHDIMTRRFGGVGVGLYVSRALAEAHGGRVWVESAGPDAGSTFTLALPLA